MRHRFRGLGGAFVVACLLLGMLAQGVAAREQNVCVSYDGQNYVDLGDTECSSTEGSAAVAVGDGALSETYEGTGNTTVAIGDNSFAGTYDNDDESDNNTIVAVGDYGYADAYESDNGTSVTVGEFGYSGTYYGNNSTAVNTGEGDEGFYYAYAYTDGDNNTAVNTGDEPGGDFSQTYVEVYGNGSTGINLDDDTQLTVSGDRCFVVQLGGTEYEIGDCD